MLRKLNRLIDSIAMYRLTLMGLTGLAVWSVMVGFFGKLPFTAQDLIFSALLLLVSCYIVNGLLSKLFKAPINVESSLITALILFFVLSPAVTVSHGLALVVAGTVAMMSKYFLALGRKHIFNPAAITAVIFSLFTDYGSTWWVGSAWLFPVILVVGVLVIKKIRRWDMAIATFATALVTALLFDFFNTRTVFSVPAFYDLLSNFFIIWPTVFFIAIMVTEPLTMPSGKKWRWIYGIMIGFLYAAPIRLGSLYTTPELSLVAGNVLAYIVSPKYKLFLHLVSKNKIGNNIYDFVFKPQRSINFKAGQYMEWTLPHHRPDGRGNRRYFTLASSPTEPTVNIGVKIQPEDGSSFKRAMFNLRSDQVVVASQLAGEFILPKKVNRKLVFMAGGIGITPFRSMLVELMDKKEVRDIILFYSASSPDEFVYDDVLNRAKKDLSLKIIYVISSQNRAPDNWDGEVGFLNSDMVTKHVSDYQDRVFYLSGPSVMVGDCKYWLQDMGVKNKNIITDYFSGY